MRRCGRRSPTTSPIIKKSLGWLDIQQHMLEEVPGLRKFARDGKEQFDAVVVCGMGGSSLAPDILADTFGEYPRVTRKLFVLDSTCPQQIKELEAQIPIARTLFIISSKSGTTTEPNAFYAYFHDKVGKTGRLRPRPDATSSRLPIPVRRSIRKRREGRLPRGFRQRSEHRRPILGALVRRHRAVGDRRIRHQPAARPRARRDARQRSYRRSTQRAGRALRRRDRRRGEERARQADDRHAPDGEGLRRVGRTAHRRVDRQRLGRASCRSKARPRRADRSTPTIGSSSTSAANLPDPDPGIDEKLTALEAAGHPVDSFGDERRVRSRRAVLSVGDRGRRRRRRSSRSMRSISPTCKSRKTTPSRCSSSTRSNGSFDEPKRRRRRRTASTSPISPAASIDRRANAGAGAGRRSSRSCGRTITTRSPRTSRATRRTRELLDELRLKIRDAHNVATTVGFGPRFLHSTGQLHKGGPDTCVVLQITADDPDDPPIPGMNVGFRTLLAAQALGDWQSLDKRNRRGVRVHFKGDVETGTARAHRGGRRGLVGARHDRPTIPS